MVIRGRVADETGRPVAGASVYISTSPQPVPDIAQLTDEKGAFAMGAPVAGKYVIGARSDEATGEVAVDVAAANVDVEIVLRR